MSLTAFGQPPIARWYKSIFSATESTPPFCNEIFESTCVVSGIHLPPNNQERVISSGFKFPFAVDKLFASHENEGPSLTAL